MSNVTALTESELEDIINDPPTPEKAIEAQAELDYIAALRIYSGYIMDIAPTTARRGFDSPPPPPNP